MVDDYLESGNTEPNPQEYSKYYDKETLLNFIERVRNLNPQAAVLASMFITYGDLDKERSFNNWQEHFEKGEEITGARIPFKQGKKDEEDIFACLELSIDEGDVVLRVIKGNESHNRGPVLAAFRTMKPEERVWGLKTHQIFGMIQFNSTKTTSVILKLAEEISEESQIVSRAEYQSLTKEQQIGNTDTSKDRPSGPRYMVGYNFLTEKLNN